MLLPPETMIAGFPAKSLRNVLRHLYPGTWVASGILARLKAANLIVQDDTLTALVAADVLTPEGHDTDFRQDTYRVGRYGIRLSGATFTPLTRAAADLTLERLLANAAAINARETFAYCVAELRVFGSYCTDAQQLGDLDVAVTLAPRYATAAQQQAAERSYMKRPQYTRAGTILGRAVQPKHDVMRLLKQGAARAQLVTRETLDELGGASRVVFSASPPTTG